MGFRRCGHAGGVAANDPPEDGESLERRFEVTAEPAFDGAIPPAWTPAFPTPDGASIRDAVRVGPPAGIEAAAPSVFRRVSRGPFRNTPSADSISVVGRAPAAGTAVRMTVAP